jgi:hypothetical protein
MDSNGLAFENFDSNGMFREQENGVTIGFSRPDGAVVVDPVEIPRGDQPGHRISAGSHAANRRDPRFIVLEA